MSTRAYPSLRDELADGWERLYASAVLSGIVGDAAHALRGGYHRSREDNPARNYSIVRVDDRAGMGPDDAASGVDMTMNSRDMVLCTKRLKAVWENKADPRRKFFNAFNGWTGSGPALRYDMVSGKRSAATADHKWHIHLEARRRWANSRAMVVAALSALAGESVAGYLKRIGVTAKATQPAAKTATAKGPTVPAYPGRILRRNDRQAKADPAVKTWQERMRARGWKSIGKADGYYGEKTEAVCRRFQATCRVAADGTIGPITWPLPWTRPLGS